MLLSLALIFIVGITMSAICHKVKLPHIVGLIVTGIVLGPYILNLIDPTILNISSELRQIALIIILIKAGLSLNINDLKKVGRPAILMSFLPASCEILAFVLFAPLILKISYTEAAIMGSVLAAVSPAVTVPKMVQLMENNYGTQKGIPQLILAGASMDDIFVIVLFSTFIGLEKGEGINALSLANVPISIVLGILVGIVVGFVLSFILKKAKGLNNIKQLIIILAVSFLLITLENVLKGYIAVSGLLAVMSMATVINRITPSTLSKPLSGKFGKLWIVAEIMLFVLVGSAVDINYLLNISFSPFAMIFIALAFRSVGVMLCLIKTKLNFKERVFCVIAYLPKATVQAAIGSVPLSMGLSCGNIVLTVAVLAIVVTAPLGAIGMELTYKYLLQKDDND